MSHLNETICIEIAAYKEFELLNTVHSALLQADNPNRIHFSICYQYDLKDDYYELLKIPHCRIKYFKESETKGLCFARNHCQHLIEDEEYVLQIDAHMRFVKHWDTKMIEQLLGTKDKNAIISFYPSNCKEDMMKLDLDDPVFDQPCSSCVLCASSFKDYPCYFVTFTSYPRNEKNGYLRNPYISGNNFFTFSRVHKVVYNDPDMFFYADELAMALRLFTYGYNVYVPTESYIYHQYERKTQSFPKITTQMLDEDKRFRRLVEVGEEEINLGEYGLGNQRTLAQYEAFSGIDFLNRKLDPKTKLGHYDIYDYEHLKKTPKKKLSKEIALLKEREQMEVYIVDLFGDYMDTIQSCLSTASRPEYVHFVVGTTGLVLDESLYEKYHISRIQSFKKNTPFSKILSSITKKLGKGSVAIVDSHVHFLKNWDAFYFSQMLAAGENAVLSSWTWFNPKTEEADSMNPYTNIVYEFNGFEGNYPKLVYHQEIDISSRKVPYPVAFFYDFFFFGFADTFKKVPFDPELNVDEERILYGLRLWTNGFDLYMPRASHLVRIADPVELKDGIFHPTTVAGLFRIDSYEGKQFQEDYPYGLGTKRTLASFFDYIHYDPEKK